MTHARLALFLVLFGSAPSAVAEPQGTGVCVSPGTVDMSYEEWCRSVAGSWDGTYCRCDGSGTSSSSDSYDYAAEQRAAEWRRQQEELARLREEQLQREALEHAAQMARQLQEQDDRGAALGVQARQLQRTMLEIKERETNASVVTKDLAPVVVPQQQTKSPPLSATQFIDFSKLPPRKPIVGEVPPPEVVKAPRRVELPVLDAKAFESLNPLTSRERLSAYLGTPSEVRAAMAEEAKNTGKEALTRELGKIPGVSLLVDAHGQFESFKALKGGMTETVRNIADRNLNLVARAAAWLGSPSTADAPDDEGGMGENVEEVKAFQQAQVTDSLTGAIRSKAFDSLEPWFGGGDD